MNLKYLESFFTVNVIFSSLFFFSSKPEMNLEERKNLIMKNFFGGGNLDPKSYKSIGVMRGNELPEAFGLFCLVRPDIRPVEIAIY